MTIEIKKEGLSMVANDTARLLMELEVIANTLISDEDVAKLKLRFEEVANNYNVDRKFRPVNPQVLHMLL